MRMFLYALILALFAGCAIKQQEIIPIDKADLYEEIAFKDLSIWQSIDHNDALATFRRSCQNTKTKEIYAEACQNAKSTNDAKLFFEQNFTPYKLKNSNDGSEVGLLTGYYEPLINASLAKSPPYIYPLYKTPKDLITVELSSLYADLGKYRLRGKLEGNKLIPYDERKIIDKNGIDADVICYCDSRVDLFFLEVQGSGIAKLEDGSTIYIGYENQNGHPYRSIGRYLIDQGVLTRDEVSLQSIKAYLEANPSEMDKVLDQNPSKVFFTTRSTPAVGAMGVSLTQMQSIAIDTEFTPLGTMMLLSARDDDFSYNAVVTAEDRGGAIKGSLRADLFAGRGDEAEALAGRLKARLLMWQLRAKGSK